MKYLALTLFLAGAVQAGQLKIRAERNYDAALKIVEIAEGKNKAAVRHRLLARAAPILRTAAAWSAQAARKGEDVKELSSNLRALHSRIARGRSSFVASTDRQPVVPNTGTTIVVARDPETAASQPRVDRRAELNSWRVRRTLARVGSGSIERQQVRLTRSQSLRDGALKGPKNIERLNRRAQLNAWRLARVEARTGGR
ncbi:MAG: hypothetical protein ACYTEG_13755 [Planctomycetota bacterium]|jgi:hypothetical protein